MRLEGRPPSKSIVILRIVFYAESSLALLSLIPSVNMLKLMNGVFLGNMPMHMMIVKNVFFGVLM